MTAPRPVRIFAGAGEASGDRILAAVLAGLAAEIPEIELRGFGGPLCAAQGLASPYSLRDLAVNGAGDVLRKIFFLARAHRKLRHELTRFEPDLVLLVDYPGMNVGLARRALKRGIPVHFIAPPQLWAYRDPTPRLRRLRRALGNKTGGNSGATLQVLFPFEAASYTPWNAPVSQGHFFPLPAFEPPRGTRLLLCPGSRRGVLRRNLPLWLARVEAFFGTLEGVDVLVPRYLAGEAARHCATFGDPGPRVVTDKDRAFAEAGAAIAFPGTMTLEIFLARIPARAWAVLDPLTLWLGKRKLRGPWVSLPNVLAGRAVLPEWIGTATDFKRDPPELPANIAGWNPAEQPGEDAVTQVWMRMGSDEGVKVAVEACRAALTLRPDIMPGKVAPATL